MFAARYDLGIDIASFDFYTVLVIAAAKGATEIIFGVDRVKTTKWSEEEVKQRFESIIQPGPAFLNLSSTIGDGGERICTPNGKSLVEFCKKSESFPRLRSVLPPGNEQYTVTLRRDYRLPERNSNEKAWRQFAKDIGAIVFEEYSVSPIHIHDRMALYAGAEMNFGVPNGPLHVANLSDYPVMLFAANKIEGLLGNLGIPIGSQLPWSLPNQTLIWEDDDLPTLHKYFEIWKKKNGDNS